MTEELEQVEIPIPRYMLAVLTKHKVRSFFPRGGRYPTFSVRLLYSISYLTAMYALLQTSGKTHVLRELSRNLGLLWHQAHTSATD